MMPTGADTVQVTLPPYSEYLRTVRLVAADAAVRAGLDVDEVEDFRIAVDELCHLLMTSTDHEVTVNFGVRGACALARGSALAREQARMQELPPLPLAIVRSVADYFETSVDGDELTFSVMKRHWALAVQR
jgi:serine/threonine-protein kinase RsbW